MCSHSTLPEIALAVLIRLTVCVVCIDTYLARSNSCPMCRHNINANSFLEVPPEVSEWVEPDDSAPPIKSAKIAELVKYLKLFNKDDKTLVFSQFTSFLDHVAASLRSEGIKYCRFDGSMNPKQVGQAQGHCARVGCCTEMDAETRGHCSIPKTNRGQESISEPCRHAHFAQIRCSRTESHCRFECFPCKPVPLRGWDVQC